MHSDNQYTINRKKLKVLIDEYVESNNETYKITQVLNFTEVIGINIKTKKPKRLLIKDLHPTSLDNKSSQDLIERDLSDISDSDWKTMEKRLLAIKPILERGSRKEIEEYAHNAGVHYTTLYKWAKGYISTGTITGLLPKKRGRVLGEVRIERQAEEIIQKAIADHYLRRIKPSVQYVINIIIYECQEKNLTPPSNNTIRNRINQISAYQKAKKRGSKSETRTKFNPVPGKYKADYPLQIVEIDHTIMDVQIVSGEDRLWLGKPVLTMAIDVFSRMVTGFHLSLDAPSGLSVSMCVTNSILPKNEWLQELGVDSNWDLWGFMDTLHADNGADFRAEALSKACKIHEINLEWRSPGKSHQGGHIERLLGTMMKKVHEIPGTTFSNIKERLDYDSEGNACMTFEELTKWLTTFITKIYHKDTHGTLKMSPEEKWEEGIFGTGRLPGIGLPPIPTNPDTLMLDFLPMAKRTMRKTGVHLNNLQYYDFVLRPFIGEKDPHTQKSKQYIFKIDPNDISYIWFYNEQNKQYHKISLANRAIPSMRLSEYNEIQKQLTPIQKSSARDAEIIRAHAELREMTEESVKKTKKARRDKEKRLIHNSQLGIIKSNTKHINPQKNSTEAYEEFDEDDIPVFDVHIEGEDNV